MPQPFKCPSCGGPLVYDGLNVTVRCHYCGNSAIVPEELRAASPRSSAAPQAHTHDQFAKLAEIGRLIRAGNMIGAIKLYRETFHTGLKEAKDAVDRLAAGKSVEISSMMEIGGSTTYNPQQVPSWPNQQVTPQLSPEAVATAKRAGCSVLAIVVAIIAVTFVVGIGIAIYSIYFVNQTIRDATRPSSRGGQTTPRVPAGSKTTTPDFASLVLQFGSEGIGAGQFKDSRSIAVDGQGHIYVGEYTGGRVQVFDSNGKFMTQWTVNPKSALRQLAADRRGVVYVVQDGDISRREGVTGKPLGKVERESRSSIYYEDVVMTLDGGMVVVSRGEDLMRLDAEGRVMLDVKDAISEQSGRSELHTRIAVDGLGNIYALGIFNNAVFKFSPNGKFLTRFGGDGDQPGQFRAPHTIAVDGQGRIYVADIKGIQVFDENGRYLGLFDLEIDLAFGMVFNDRNELFAAARKLVYKFAVNK